MPAERLAVPSYCRQRVYMGPGLQALWAIGTGFRIWQAAENGQWPDDTSPERHYYAEPGFFEPREVAGMDPRQYHYRGLRDRDPGFDLCKLMAEFWAEELDKAYSNRHGKRRPNIPKHQFNGSFP